MKSIIFSFLLIISLSACRKYCDQSLLIGEIVQIPVEFVGFSSNKVNNITVYKINKLNPSLVDTFPMWAIIWGNQVRFNQIITDKVPPGVVDSFDYYDSYFDNSHLILDWQTGRDTLSDFRIKKSRGESEDCHKGDPNVKIDQFSFVHKGKTISKRESIKINR